MRVAIYFIIFLFGFMNPHFVSAAEKPFIAKWYKNYKAAVSLRFDDAHVSHVNVVIPLLNQYDIKGTFMVNPGRGRYKEYKEIWEKDVPLMGHRLGNHTMNHRGAKDLEEAEYEIGEASRIIWELYPQASKLLVFASGGGKKWGGEYWESASVEYKDIVKKYHMIDLYDGNHPSRRGDAKTSGQQLCSYIDKAIQENKHQAFHFHNIGEKDFIEWAKTLLRRNDLSMSTYEFGKFIQCIDRVKNDVWVAPLSDILKYEEEYYNATLDILEDTARYWKMRLKIDSDSALYNQTLTLVIPNVSSGINKILQNGIVVNDFSFSNHILLFNVSPTNSELHIFTK